MDSVTQRTWVLISGLKCVTGNVLRHVVTIVPVSTHDDEDVRYDRSFTKSQFEDGGMIDWIVEQLELQGDLEDV